MTSTYKSVQTVNIRLVMVIACQFSVVLHNFLFPYAWKHIRRKDEKSPLAPLQVKVGDRLASLIMKDRIRRMIPFKKRKTCGLFNVRNVQTKLKIVWKKSKARKTKKKCMKKKGKAKASAVANNSNQQKHKNCNVEMVVLDCD